MRKFYHIILIALLFTSIISCSWMKDGANEVADVLKPSAGIWYVAILTEMNSNFSSLIYDKTRAKFSDYKFTKSAFIKTGKNFFIIPPIDRMGDYDISYKNLMENIISLNKLGTISNSAEDADYILVLKIDDNVSKYFGKNFTYVEISIFDANKNLVTFSSVNVYSKSDENFFYFPSKPAKPVSYLKVKGLEYVIKKSFPKVFVKGEKDA